MLIPIGLKLGIITPTVEATYMDGEKRVLSVRGDSPHDLNVKLNSALTFLEAQKVTPTKGNVIYSSGYISFFADRNSTLLNRKELGGNSDEGLRNAWAFLGKIQESSQG